jgi:hypothetical protein
MKINLLILSVFLTLIIYARVHELHGIVGLTRLDGALGCVCHNVNSNDSVSVWIEGPDSIKVNTFADFKIFMTGGPAVSGGFNVAARLGLLDTLDGETKIIIGQLTHSSPKLFINDTVFWGFKYSAPDSIITDTIYSVANSVNGDSIPNSFDKWNFGENFVVNVYDDPTNIYPEAVLADEFILEQNYPNPFNPATNLRFRISDFGFVTLVIYDILGNIITTLANEYKAPGEHQVSFDGSGLSSGIYYYSLQFNNSRQTKKMILIK